MEEADRRSGGNGLVEALSTSRIPGMHILGAGRSAFLEFLRNLTPAILIGSVSVATWAKLDFQQVDMGNWFETLVFVGTAVTATLAFFANMWGFLDQAFAPLPGVDRIMKRLVRRDYSKRILLVTLIRLAGRERPVIVLEVTVTIAVIYVAMFAGVRSAFSAAIAVLRSGI
jgi:hypothetical protein